MHCSYCRIPSEKRAEFQAPRVTSSMSAYLSGIHDVSNSHEPAEADLGGKPVPDRFQPEMDL